jgi:hypothetical protein
MTLSIFTNGLAIFAMLVITVIAALGIRTALKTGVTGIGGWPIAVRAQRPYWFWLYIAFQALIGAVCLWLGLQGTISLFP